MTSHDTAQRMTVTEPPAEEERPLVPVSEQTREKLLGLVSGLPEEEPTILSRRVYFSRIPVRETQEDFSCQELRLLLVLRGSGKLTAEGCTTALEQGSLALLGAQTPHQLLLEPETLALGVRLAWPLAEKTLFQLTDRDELLGDYFRKTLSPEVKSFLLFREPENELLMAPLAEMLREGTVREPYADFCGCSYLLLMFAALLRHYSRICSVSWDPLGDPPQITIPAILLTIRDEYRTVTLGDLARRFGYNESYLSVLLKKCTGRNFTELVAVHRLGEAKYLLQNTALSLEQVAGCTGFGSAVHLSRCFRRCTGQTPGAYRRHTRIEG